jgi:hypothetical protein
MDRPHAYPLANALLHAVDGRYRVRNRPGEGRFASCSRALTWAKGPSPTTKPRLAGK